MNEKFFSLPVQKQERIINAGFRVFSQSSYKKCPVSEIADEAGISKALLFHYFKNKKELYLFLWSKCAEITMRSMDESRSYETDDLFEAMEKGMMAKLGIMRRYPDIGSFALKAFYEKDPEISPEIRKSIGMFKKSNVQDFLGHLDRSKFIPGLDISMMYMDMYWATEGYMWEKMQSGTVNVDETEAFFRKMISFWKSVYLRKGE